MAIDPAGLPWLALSTLTVSPRGTENGSRFLFPDTLDLYLPDVEYVAESNIMNTVYSHVTIDITIVRVEKMV